MEFQAHCVQQALYHGEEETFFSEFTLHIKKQITQLIKFRYKSLLPAISDSNDSISLTIVFFLDQIFPSGAIG